MKRSKWSMAEQAVFLSKLGELLEHGYPLSHAIQFIGLQESAKKTEALDSVLDYLKQGETLYHSLEKISFDKQIISYIYYAENYGGNLPAALKEGGGFWKSRSEDLIKIRKLLVYPLFLLLFTGTVFFTLQKVLLPKFQSLFSSMDAGPNIFLEFIRNISVILHYSPFCLLASAFLLFTFRYFWYSRQTPLRQRKFLQSIPFAGSLVKLYDTHFFATQLSGLLAGGLSINQSISLFAENQSEPFYEELCSLIRYELTQGKALESIFRDLPYFEPAISMIIAIGQKYGTLDKELFLYGRYILSKIEERINAALRFVQPVLFSVVGLLVVSIYLAVLMPMFSLLDGL
ncbi:competence type IV pilus assembly protein ComGB [Peribacillus sp. SCS-155]|uniref:competence type IV pilus assembly protein ComGB n=1 Tax=Peribacillus sedimenti TaxID=3115297 RepID=UPI003906BBD3